MKSLAFLCLALLATASALAQGPAKLRWRNGETLAGEITAATAEQLTWKTPLFDDPLLLHWSALQRIEQTLASSANPDPFSIVLRDGSHLYGQLVGITESTLSIRSTRHGEASLKRSEVLSVRRLKGAAVVTAGPTGDVGWKVVESDTNPDEKKSPPVALLTTGPAGSLALPYWNTHAQFKTTLPPLADIEFRLRSSKRPDFRLVLGGDGKQQLRVETWGGEIVLTAADQFKIVRAIKDDEREVALRVCWDRKSRRASVFTATGEKLVDWTVPDETGGSRPGLLLHNKGRDLSLEHLRVRHWNGNPPGQSDPRQPRVELADGRILAGEVASLANDSLALKGPEADPTPPLPLADVETIIFSADAPKVAAQPVEFAYADATRLGGQLTAVRDGKVVLATSFAEAPLESQLGALRRMSIDIVPPKGAPAETPLAELDEITIQQTTLHGTLTGGGDQYARWLPVGGVSPATPARSTPNKISRAFGPDKKAVGAPTLFYTSAGDILPGTLRSLTREAIEFESPLIEAKRLPASGLDGIQLEATTQRSLDGFGAPGWRIVKGDADTVKIEGAKVTLQPETAFGHPAAMLGNEIKMTFDSENFMTVRLRLFCAGTDPAQALSLVVVHWGERVSSGLEGTEGQFQNQLQTKVAAGPITMRLAIQEKSVELYFNDLLAQKFPVEGAKRLGAGLVIEPSSMWGNSVNPISVSDFSARAVPGRAWLPDVPKETKQQALTIPRFRKESPPRQALLAANGDVLRGEIEAVTSTHLAFRSGLEVLKVPLDRVKAVIWLKPAEKGTPAAAPIANAGVLEKKIQRRTRYRGGALSSLVHVLELEAPELKFKYNAKDDTRRVSMDFGGQTIGEALDQICSLFNLRYRLEGSEVILESGPQGSTAMLQKVYWVKAGAFPAAPAVQELLGAKGLTFPKGASASWQAAAQQLTMTNTVANHDKLLSVLSADFGGSLGSPTHWLLLTTGARLGLAVDQFEKEVVVGHHPLYGKCRIPMAQLYVIRTSVPEPTAAMKSLADWQLVYAPEPVIPDGGGEASALLGKDAAPFKLPLLAGGEFDLAQQKGKIVVLDFWATWCGPCIKSLPGLTAAVAAFPKDKVQFIGVNQSEPADHVKQFMETRGWDFTVALDAGGAIGQKYGAEGIPFTVIVAPDGKVAWVKSGYSPEGEQEAAAVIKKLLEPAKPGIPTASVSAPPTPAS